MSDDTRTRLAAANECREMAALCRGGIPAGDEIAVAQVLDEAAALLSAGEPGDVGHLINPVEELRQSGLDAIAHEDGWVLMSREYADQLRPGDMGLREALGDHLAGCPDCKARLAGLSRTRAVTQAIAFEQANDNDPEIIAKFMALDQAGPEIAAALTRLAGYVETFGGVDNGYCRECGRHRKYTDGSPERCSNPDCLSNPASPTDRERVDPMAVTAQEIEWARTGSKIRAVKSYRNRTGTTLRLALDAIDAAMHPTPTSEEG